VKFDNPKVMVNHCQVHAIPKSCMCFCGTAADEGTAAMRVALGDVVGFMHIECVRNFLASLPDFANMDFEALRQSYLERIDA
jgi:hypothetical protein